MIAIHTEKGVIFIANDFKMDDTPVLGLKPNYKVLREIADEGVLCFIVDSLYSGTERKTPSERLQDHYLKRFY
jgi:mRNA degradation ribonuclease J1/J2